MKTIKNDNLGNRIKNYEGITRQFLIPKVPTILRLDGIAFHTYTKKFKRPFDDVLINAMNETAIYLCSKIQGAKFAFVQSDEISIYLSDRDNIESQLWYKGNIQKIVSASASFAAAKFNQLMFIAECNKQHGNSAIDVLTKNDITSLKLAEFDSRVFQVPNDDEVLNTLLWRQNDCTRNSISSVAQSLYSHTELNKKNTKEMQELIFQKGQNWDKLDPLLKRGRFINKNTYVNGSLAYKKNDNYYLDQNYNELVLIDDNSVIRHKWEVIECPIFSKQREFILNKL